MVEQALHIDRAKLIHGFGVIDVAVVEHCYTTPRLIYYLMIGDITVCGENNQDGKKHVILSG